MNGRAQIFQLSTPWGGVMSLSVQDVNGPAGSSGGVNLEFNHLSETIYLDPVGKTIRQVGTISCTPTAASIQFQETQTVPGRFPSPPTQVSGNVTVNLAPSGGGLSFDTGILPATWNAASSTYSVNALLLNGFPMTGSYTVVTGGQTYTGSFSYTIRCSDNQGEASIFSTIWAAAYPSTIGLSLDGLGFSGFNTSAWFPSPGIVADFKAPNGFEIQLSPGTIDFPNGDNYEEAIVGQGEAFEWGGSIEPVNANNVGYGGMTILYQPQSVVVNANGTAVFAVTALSSSPLTYQWQLNGSNISGATSSILMISNVTPTNLGTYSVLIINDLAAATIGNAVLSMPPHIETPFTGAVTYMGQSPTLTVGAWGTPPLYYQWFEGGSPISDGTNQTSTLTDIQFTNAGFYSVVVSSALGSATNAPAQVVVEPVGVSLGLFPGIMIQGMIGDNYIIQSTTNLGGGNPWATVAHLTLTQPVQIWIDSNTDTALPGAGSPFYQVLAGH